ncbi:MAG: hypothetical protein LBQ54_10420 [Planctomycetaceae bacterium]|nr:hypothetical protein [Planctomycetaceae bacterium]
MEIFVESPWVWIAITIFMLLVSYAFYVNDRNIKRLMIMLLTAAIILGGGLLLDYCVETDREKISVLLNQIAQALLDDDLEAVEQHLAPDAEYTRNLAAAGMAIAALTVAKVNDLQIDYNDATSPPTAVATFAGSFRGETKGGFYGKMPFAQIMKFEVLLEKNEGRWYVTDEFTYDPPVNGLPRRTP